MQGFLGTFDLDVEILDTIEGDSLAKAGEGFDGHDRGLGVGTGWVRGCVLDQHQRQPFRARVVGGVEARLSRELCVCSTLRLRGWP